MALLTPQFWISSLQNWERINLCCFKPPTLWSFVTAALMLPWKALPGGPRVGAVSFTSREAYCLEQHLTRTRTSVNTC